MKEYFIVSDIHAHYDLLLDALLKHNFDIRNKEHILIVAGDVLDRGKQGDELILFLELLIKQNRLLGVVGNHDLFLIDILNQKANLRTIEWNMYHNGFTETLLLGLPREKISSIHKQEVLKEMRENFIAKYSLFTEWMLSLPVYLEFEHHVIVHAFLDFSLPDWHNTELKFAVWERRYQEKIPASFEKKLIFGHTPNFHINGQNDVIYDGKKIMIDGGAAGDRQINVLHYNENEL